MRRKLTLGRIIMIVIGIVAQIACCFPWLQMEKHSYTTIGYLVRLYRSSDIVETVWNDMGAISSGTGVKDVNFTLFVYVFAGELIIWLVIQILCLIHLLICFRKKPRDVIYCIALVLSVLVCYLYIMNTSEWFNSWIVFCYPYIVVLIMLTGFLANKFIDGWKSASTESKVLREIEKKENKERRERLRFDGKYSKLFYQIIWKNFKYNWRDYRMLIVGGMLSAGLIWTGFGMRELLNETHGEDHALVGQGLGTILVNCMVVLIAVSMFLIVFILLSYMRNRVKNFGAFVNLGMRKSTLLRLTCVEIGVCMVISMLCGFAVGNIIVYGSRCLLKKMTEDSVTFGRISGKTYLFTVLCSVVIFVIASMVTHDIYFRRTAYGVQDRSMEKEKMPGRWKPAGLFAGLILCVSAARDFMKPETAEGVGTIVMFLVGLYLAARYGEAIWLESRKKRREKYYASLIKRNRPYYRFRTGNRYRIFLCAIHVCVLFVFSRTLVSSLMAEEPETLFPYDFVCLATEEDQDIFEKLESDYDVEIYQYPMVRVTNVDNTETSEDYRSCMQPQGQQIGISESTYRALNENLGNTDVPKLKWDQDEEEIYVIYQQDKSTRAHPIDYFMDRTRPYIHIGQPLLQYMWTERKLIYPQRTVIGSKIGILTGAVRQGEHENIVVFSDQYFGSIQHDWKNTEYTSGIKLSDDEAVEGITIHHWPTQGDWIRLPGLLSDEQFIRAGEHYAADGSG